MGRQTRIHLAASRMHKWLALLLGAQLLIWFASGALMSFLPIERVRGEHLVDRARVEALPANTAMLSPAALMGRSDKPVEAITFRMLDGRPVAEVVGASGSTLLDGVTGARLPPLDAASAARVAAAAWRAPDKPQFKVSRVEHATPEYRGALPAWRIAFADPDHTSVFVAADSGRIIAIRTGTWRLYDFFWSLHIMDWKNHEDFNTPWLLGFALGGLALGIAGTVLLIMRWPWRRKRRP